MTSEGLLASTTIQKSFVKSVSVKIFSYMGQFILGLKRYMCEREGRRKKKGEKNFYKRSRKKIKAVSASASWFS